MSNDKDNGSLDQFLRRLITAPRARQAEAVASALALLNGKPPAQLLYSGAQVCRAISISRTSLFRLVRSGEIKPVKVRGSTRYRHTDLLALAGGEAGAQ